MKPLSIWIGYDPREIEGFVVTTKSIRRSSSVQIPMRGLDLSDLRERDLYKRPTIRRAGQLWDVISSAPMATEFALSRFLVPHLAENGWALFMDCDMLVRKSLLTLFDQADESKAVMVVKHEFEPDNEYKMGGQIQTIYARKNWSSVVLFNCDHPSNKTLTLEYVNSAKGLDLHQFAWLKDHEIGSLDEKWNYLVGHGTEGIDPAVVHFTDGIPSVHGCENAEYSQEWFTMRSEWIRYGT